ncbi:glycosyltransferase family 87 protein [Paraburkholderia sediminicola]|uniref:glycosyltransferase family 87 protein n=1 Tax=Paraburkholderia sediminicola TaxID=458836 RepID=UPI0038B9CED5
MYVSRPDDRSGENRVHSLITPQRVVVYSVAMLVLYAGFLATWAWASNGFSTGNFTKPGIDFSVFWSASYAMLHGPAWQVYDYTYFDRIEATLFHFPPGNFLPWLYPPTFLVLIKPLALVPLVVAYFLFVGISALLFVFATLSVSRLASSMGSSRLGWLIVAACPCVFVPAVFGQNSLLTAALAALAVRWIARHPARAGLCIGLLAIKPQMALLFPFVLIAARAWRTFGAAALSASLFGALSVLICGTRSLQLFLVSSRLARDLTLEHGRHYWLSSPTTFAVLREGGVPLAPAYAAEACVALIAVVAACHIWKSTRDARLRGATLAVATLLANPYVWHYELAWLGIAIACLMAIGFEKGWRRGEQGVLVLAWLLPVYEFFNRLAGLPQIGPVVLLLMLLLILRRARIVEEVTS